MPNVRYYYVKVLTNQENNKPKEMGLKLKFGPKKLAKKKRK